MNNKIKDDVGLMTVLLERYKKQRLPRVEALQAKVAGGDLLSDIDVMFLNEVASGVAEIKPLLDRHPECLGLATHMANLCNDVAKKGLANEKPA